MSLQCQLDLSPPGKSNSSFTNSRFLSGFEKNSFTVFFQEVRGKERKRDIFYRICKQFLVVNIYFIMVYLFLAVGAKKMRPLVI